MAYTEIPSTDIDVDSPITSDLMTDLKDNDEACADNPFWFELAEQSETLGSWQVETEFDFRVPKSGKVVKFAGQMKMVGGGTAYCRFKVKGTSTYSDTQTETNTAYQDKTWTFSDLSGSAGTNIVIEVEMYQSGGTTAYMKADGSLKSYCGRT